jgi:hypothetical protein
MSSNTLSLPAATGVGSRALPAAGLVVGTTVANVVAAIGIVAAFDLSTDFEALQPGAIGGATLISTLLGVATLVGLRRMGPASADRRYAIAVIVGGLLSMAGPASLASNDGSIVGWSAGAVWALVPLHLIPMFAALALPRLMPVPPTASNEG